MARSLISTATSYSRRLKTLPRSLSASCRRPRVAPRARQPIARNFPAARSICCSRRLPPICAPRRSKSYSATKSTNILTTSTARATRWSFPTAASRVFWRPATGKRPTFRRQRSRALRRSSAATRWATSAAGMCHARIARPPMAVLVSLFLSLAQTSSSNGRFRIRRFTSRLAAARSFTRMKSAPSLAVAAGSPQSQGPAAFRLIISIHCLALSSHGTISPANSSTPAMIHKSSKPFTIYGSGYPMR